MFLSSLDAVQYLQILKFIVEKSKATVRECEENLDINKRTLQRELKKLPEMKLIIEVSTSATDPQKYYVPNIEAR